MPAATEQSARARTQGAPQTSATNTARARPRPAPSTSASASSSSSQPPHSGSGASSSQFHQSQSQSQNEGVLIRGPGASEPKTPAAGSSTDTAPISNVFQPDLTAGPSGHTTYPSIQAAPESYILARLLQLADAYLQPAFDSSNQQASTPDLTTATFYAERALALAPTSVRARRLLATCLLRGGDPLPFGPASARPPSRSTSSSSASSSTGLEATRAGAHAALHLLRAGGKDVYADIGCAQIYAAACNVLGRYREAAEALEWTLKNGAKQTGNGEASGELSLIGLYHDLPTRARHASC